MRGPAGRPLGLHAALRPRPRRGARPRRRRGRAADQPLPLRAGAGGRGLPGRASASTAAAPPAGSRRPAAAPSRPPSTCPTCCASAAQARRRRRPLPVADGARPSTRCCCRRGRPRVMTAHYILPPEPSRRQLASARRVFGAHGRGRRPLRARRRAPARRGRPRPEPGPRHPPRRLRLPDPPAGGEAAAGRAGGRRGPGDPLLRPAAPLQGDRHPARGLPPASRAPSSGSSATRAWRSSRCAASPPRRPGRVRFLTRFVEDAEIPAIFRRADVVVLPYRDAEHSGVLYTGLAFGKPLVLSAVGGFPEVAEQGAARLVPPEDPAALAAALSELVGDEARASAARRSRRQRRRRPLLLGRGRRQTLALYRELLERTGR